MSDLRPERQGLRPGNLNLRPERRGLGPARLDLRPGRLDFRPERLDLRLERPDSRPVGLEGGQTNKQTNGQMEVPLCSTGVCPLRAC